MPGVDDFFDKAVQSGAPSASLKVPNDFVRGEIVDQFTVEAKKFGTDEVERDRKTGEPVMQLVVVLQTDLRNWQGVSRIPKVDPTDRNSADKPASEDDGKRALYIKPFTNLHGAVGKAIVEATGKKGPLRNGGTLGVKITRLEDTGKGNPLKHHAAVYEAPAASGGDFFGEGNTASSAPASSPAPTPSQDPWTGQPAASPAPAQPVVRDEPPF